METSSPGIPSSENERPKESLYTEIKDRKEQADLASRLDRLQGRLSIKDMFTGYFLTAPGDNIHLGDYGFRTQVAKDYLLKRIFAASGFKDSSGDDLTVDRIRKIANLQEDEYPKLKFEGDKGNSVSINFYAGKDNMSFNAQLEGYDSDLKNYMLADLSGIPAFKWGEGIVQEISNHQEKIRQSSGEYMIDLGVWESADVNEDLAFFLNHFEFGLDSELTSSELDSLLKGEDNSKAGEDAGDSEKWISFQSRNLGGVAVTFRKDGEAVKAALLVDTNELKGRNDKGKFIDSNTAKDLVGAMEKLGVRPSEEVMNDLTEGSLEYGHYGDRYGNGYADLSRLVAYSYREGHGIEKVFDTQGKQILPEDIIKISEGLSAPAKLVLEQIAALAKGKVQDSGVEITNFSGESVRAGSCKDSEVYFSSTIKRGKSMIEGNFLVKSGNGADTKMNIEPITDGNIVFPPGYLFRVGGGGKLEPLRATMYCFNNDDARDAFGWQYVEGMQNDPYLKWAIEGFPEDWKTPKS